MQYVISNLILHRTTVQKKSTLFEGMFLIAKDEPKGIILVAGNMITTLSIGSQSPAGECSFVPKFDNKAEFSAVCAK